MAYLKYNTQYNDTIHVYQHLSDSIVNTLKKRYDQLQYKFETMYASHKTASSIKFITDLQQKRKEYQKNNTLKAQQQELEEICREQMDLANHDIRNSTSNNDNMLTSHANQDQQRSNQIAQKAITLQYIPQIVKYQLMLIGVCLVIILFMLAK